MAEKTPAVTHESRERQGPQGPQGLQESQELRQHPRRVKNGCENCRLRHLKCDDYKPSCLACTIEGRTCTRRLRTQFRHGCNPSIRAGHKGKAKTNSLQYGFDPDQPWCRTRRPLTFVDENRELFSLYADGFSDEAAAAEAETTKVPFGLVSPPASSVAVRRPSSLDWSSPLAYSQSPSACSTLASRPCDEATAAVAAAAAVTAAATAATAAAIAAARPGHGGIDISALIHPPEEQLPSPGDPYGLLPAEPPVWPLRDRMEACLFRYFIELSAKWFDLCDHERTFAVVVPCRAVLHAPLMNAIFAVSARHLSLTSAFDKSISDRYYHRCLTTLRPMLSDNGALVDENLFAAAVILRNFEEIEIPLAGAQPSTHLLGNSLFVKASATLHDSAGPSAPILFSGLRRAAFLVAVRQEIYTAFVTQRSICPSFSTLAVDLSLDVEGNDCDWANRAVFLLADVLRFCYGREASMSPEAILCRYDQLVAYGQRWYEKKPLSFSPLYYKDPLAECLPTPSAAVAPDAATPGRLFFPDIWLVSDTVATGLQHYHLAQILLAAFDPRAPCLGPGRTTFVRSQACRIRTEVRVLVGIAKSNPHCRPNFVSACMGIAVAGERFEQRWEQEAIMGFLQETEALCAWRTHTARDRLSAAWGWESRDEEKK